MNLGRPSSLGVLLAPGAGADRDQATLVALDSALSAAGARVVRMDFPYRQAGRRAPDRPPVLMEAVRAEAESLSGGGPAGAGPAGAGPAGAGPAGGGRLVLGGRSMGGRMCSMAVAAGLVPDAIGLLLISYPLHPPGKPSVLRTEHFPMLTVPCLFVSGTRDAFAAPAELEAATAAIPGRVTHQWIDGKDHALRGVDERISSAAVEWVESLQASEPSQASQP